jgi:YVTN family beta-propeller protein
MNSMPTQLKTRATKESLGGIFAAILCLLGTVSAHAANELQVEAIISLGEISGRLDHLAVDLGRKRLYVAELGNDSVGVVDVASRSTVRTLTGFDEPQGIAYGPETDTVYVASGGDGSLRCYSGDTLEQRTRIELGHDADNVRVAAQSVLVGFGSALALVDARSHAVRTIGLGGHPESFQFDPKSNRVYVNVPTRRAVAVIDLRDEHVSWVSIPIPGANFPMARDDSRALLLPLRHPANLLALDIDHWQRARTTNVCEDADDIFLDARRRRAYVSCGDGHIDVLERDPTGFTRTGQIKTAHGARTSLFVPEWDRLFVAVPASAESPAAIWIMSVAR